MKRKTVQLVMAGMGILLLGGCSTANQSASQSSDLVQSTEASSKNEDEQGKKDAEVLLNFLYKGKKSEQLQDVTNQSADSVNSYLISKLSEKQDEMFSDNDNKDDYFLVIDGSNYYASDIVKDYSNAYLHQTNQIDFDITDVEVSGKEATISVSYYPIAGLEEANPIGTARTELFGGIDEDTFIRQSQNKDIKTIKSLITLKLYGIYYGDLDYEAAKVTTPVDMKFTLSKKGDHFMANDDVIYQIVKDSRVKSYADNNSDLTEDSSDSL